MTNPLTTGLDRLMKLKAAGRKSYAKKPSTGASGFAEEALLGLADLDSGSGFIDTVPPSACSQNYLRVNRLSKNVSECGGFVSKEQGDPASHYWGHRKQLRERFLSGGHKPMPEYEMLELLLFNAIERTNVKPLAIRLLTEFGDLNGVIAASEHRLLKVNGATSKVFFQLRVAEAFAQRMGQAKVLMREAVSSWDDLITYCRTSMAYRETEQLRLLFLDGKNFIVADEVQAAGTVDHVPVYPREVAKRALELNARAVIMVHNHPSGDPTPSQQDITMTEAVNSACKSIGVTIHDHVIIGKGNEFSFKSAGLFN